MFAPPKVSTPLSKGSSASPVCRLHVNTEAIPGSSATAQSCTCSACSQELEGDQHSSLKLQCGGRSGDALASCLLLPDWWNWLTSKEIIFECSLSGKAGAGSLQEVRLLHSGPASRDAEQALLYVHTLTLHRSTHARGWPRQRGQAR